MTATAWEVAATTTVADNTPETPTRQLRAHLQALATRRLAPHSAQSPEQSRFHLVPGAGVDGPHPRPRPRVVIVGAGFADFRAKMEDWSPRKYNVPWCSKYA